MAQEVNRKNLDSLNLHQWVHISIFKVIANIKPQNLPILPALLQTAMLALLTASIPLTMNLTSILIAVDSDGGIMSDPPPKLLKSATSVHVLAFSSLGDLLVVESEGDFSIGTWEKVHIRAEQVCHGHEEKADGDDEDEDEDVDVDLKGASNKEDTLRSIIQEQVRKDQKWK